jgi:hypothetical protein
MSRILWCIAPKSLIRYTADSFTLSGDAGCTGRSRPQPALIVLRAVGASRAQAAASEAVQGIRLPAQINLHRLYGSSADGSGAMSRQLTIGRAVLLAMASETTTIQQRHIPGRRQGKPIRRRQQ